jgi:hypothetical protein
MHASLTSAAVTTRNAEFQFLEGECHSSNDERDVSPAMRLDQDEHLLRHLACQGRLDLLTELNALYITITDSKDIIPLPISLASAMDARKRHGESVSLASTDLQPKEKMNSR